MGENNGVIWILVAVIILGVAIFAMGQYFAGSAKNDQVKMAFTSEQGVAQGLCLADHDATDWQPDTFSTTWKSGEPTGMCGTERV